MPKLKTHSGAKKRFKVTKNGKVMHHRESKRHILTKKTAKRKRQMRKDDQLAPAEAAKIRLILQAY